MEICQPVEGKRLAGIWEIYPPAAKRARAAAAAVGQDEIVGRVVVRIVFMALFKHNDGFSASCAGRQSKTPGPAPGGFSNFG